MTVNLTLFFILEFELARGYKLLLLKRCAE